ncbi:SRPBCC family protein [Defluviimonas sp. D31]|uniref:SRPBCC family protein n=1 Tax=Defluviimonas sp. D31 TaxID=3083253 RepID=UPI00296F1037|nr:SRPBCC family protein [Defluviimonas sp. D31]MDW4551329.1 SRPBCC family protein [Defluviimonas sp. D31]
MKFSTVQDIAAPAELVFDAVSDFASFERAALRRGAEVSRVDRPEEGILGTTWSLRFPLRGRMRRLVCDVQRFEPPNAMLVGAESGGFEMTLTVGLVALARSRTRLGLDLDIRPRSLSARLVLQTLKLKRAGYMREFEGRVKRYAEELEQRHAPVA